VAGARGEVDDLVRLLVLNLASLRHKDLPGACAELDLPAPPPESDEADTPSLTKTQRMQEVFDQLDDQRYADVLRRILGRGLPPGLRNRAQDSLWALEQWPQITERVRRDVAESLERDGLTIVNPNGLMNMLHELYVLETDLAAWTGNSLAKDIERHVIRNPGDWGFLELFTQLGALTCSDRRFALFIQGLLSGAVTPDESRQRAMAEAITPTLVHAGLTGTNRRRDRRERRLSRLLHPAGRCPQPIASADPVRVHLAQA
jgi:hypothetical protein